MDVRTRPCADGGQYDDEARLNWLDDFDQQLTKAHTQQDILAIMLEVFTAQGFPSFSYVLQFQEYYHRPPVLAFMSFPPEWQAHYMLNGYGDSDPVLIYHQTHSRPWFWSVEDDWRSYGPQAVEFQQELKNWGFLRGVVLPFITTHSNGFTNLLIEGDIDHLLDRLARVNLALPYFNEHVKRVYAEQNPHSCLNVRMTPRERQIFQLVADGLTSKEIAEQLHIAQRTVETHLVTVQTKIQADNRTQALCKAVKLGLVFPRNSEETAQFFLAQQK